ncbi:hypothetical protein EV360DRAFT_85902 [Lentinula raphanica]|nr:hypothetical protein EV360DRAFT_85902 [Lentinula raphanica]
MNFPSLLRPPSTTYLEQTYQNKYEAYMARNRQNDVPLSSQEISELQKDILLTRNELRRQSGDDVHPLQSLLVKTLESQESLLSPIRSLPSELLETIFRLVVAVSIPDHVACEISLSLTDHKIMAPVFRLTWVCSWWRRLALARPVLWSSIAVVDDTQRTDGQENRPELLEYVLQRSGTSCPMDLQLHIFSRLTVTRHDTLPFLTIFSNSPFNSIQRRLAETVIKYAIRWRSFTFTTNSKMISESFLEILATEVEHKLHNAGGMLEFPSLERLDLGSVGFNLDDELPAIKMVRKTFSSCPSLHSLAMYSLTSSESLDLKNLITLELNKYTGLSFAYLLRQCPLLESLAVKFFRGQTQESPDERSVSDTVRHDHLRVLKIKGMGEEFASGAWNGLHLPKLRELLVGFWLRMEEGVLYELKDLLEHSKCNLQKVQLLWNSIHISEYSVLEKFLHDIPFNLGCEYLINEGRYPRTY